MDKPKTQFLKPELIVNESIFYSPTVTLEPAVIIDAVEKSNLIPSLTKIALCNIVLEQTLDNAIKVIDFLLKAKDLLADNPSVYNIVEK